MKQINQICHRGLVERSEKAKEAIVSTLTGFKKFITSKFENQVMEIVGRHFLEDQYLTLVRNTKGVYERRQAPENKFNQRAFELELAAITAGSANWSRQAVSSIHTAVNELKLQRTAGTPTWWERVRAIVLIPTVKWVFKIIAAVIIAVILYVLGIKG